METQTLIKQAKQFDENSTPKEGNDNWLSDTDSAPFVPEVPIGGGDGITADPRGISGLQNSGTEVPGITPRNNIALNPVGSGMPTL